MTTTTAALRQPDDAVTVDAFAFGGERCDRIVANVLERARLINKKEAMK